MPNKQGRPLQPRDLITDLSEVEEEYWLNKEEGWAYPDEDPAPVRIDGGFKQYLGTGDWDRGKRK